jgi:hypothetical protein
MQLLVDVLAHAHALHALDVARARAEGQAVQDVHRLLIGRQRRGVKRRRQDAGGQDGKQGGTAHGGAPVVLSNG